MIAIDKLRQIGALDWYPQIGGTALKLTPPDDRPQIGGTALKLTPPDDRRQIYAHRQIDGACRKINT